MWTTMRPWLWSGLLLILIAAPACGDDAAGDDDDATGDDGGPGDGDGGGTPGGCIPDGPECNNCIDDDGDGAIDGADVECTGPNDDREDSFATGIPGDNIDPVLQDCFFDGDSGEGNDGCFRPTCCLTEGVSSTCPPPGPPPNDCTVSDQCREFCEPLTPPGCDCFGCCTVCDDTGCYDIATGLATDDCAEGNLADETACPPCVKSTDCDGGDCNPLECILCPGQTEDDLGPGCEEPTCPAGVTPCASNADCADGQYCSSGCCIHIIT